MRLRALRWSVALALAVGATTAGVAVPHSSLRAVLRDVARTAAAPVQAVAAAGHHGSDLATRGHLRTTSDSGALAPTIVLATGLMLRLVATHGRRRVVAAVPVRHSSRAPPRRS